MKLKPLDLATAYSMLAVIPADDRETWLRMGMALHSEFGSDGFSLWDAWSQAAGNYDPKAAQATWRSFKSGNIGIASLIHEAKAHGWQNGVTVPIPKPKPAPMKTSDTRRYAIELWLKAKCDDRFVGSHPYSIAKGIEWAAGAGRGVASGRVIGKQADCLIIPIRKNGTGKVQAVQCINDEGVKQTFGLMDDAYLLLGNDLDKSIPWAAVEGWADAVSFVFHWHKGNAVAVAAFGIGRLDRVAKQVADQYAPHEITIIEDAK